MGQRGLAKVVHFNPVRTSDVRLPPGSAFVIANSLSVSKKAETAHTRYNARVVECRLAAAMLALALGAPQAEARAVQTLRQVRAAIQIQIQALESCPESSTPALFSPALRPRLPPPQVEAAAGGLAAAASAAERHLKEVYQPAELEAALGLPLPQLFAGSAASLGVLAHAKGGFKLRLRAVHVFSEALRVDAFAAACAAGAKLEALGALMDASHASCRDAYECSCPELEELVAAAKGLGALGARLTGAGWGGCAVMLVPQRSAAAFVDALAAKFYAPRIAAGVLKEADLPQTVFATEPASGAAIVKGFGTASLAADYTDYYYYAASAAAALLAGAALAYGGARRR